MASYTGKMVHFFCENSDYEDLLPHVLIAAFVGINLYQEPGDFLERLEDELLTLVDIAPHLPPVVLDHALFHWNGRKIAGNLSRLLIGENQFAVKAIIRLVRDSTQEKGFLHLELSMSIPD